MVDETEVNHGNPGSAWLHLWGAFLAIADTLFE